MTDCGCPAGIVHEPDCPLVVDDPHPFRVYLPAECGRDGYPLAWHEQLKHDVRREADDRCVRCKHPYKVGAHRMEAVNVPGVERAVFESWTPCDWQCEHHGPIRVRLLLHDGWQPFPTDGLTAGQLVTNLEAPMFVQAKARILTVHHLDGVKTNCRWWNLVALCQRCHLTIQGRVVMERVWPWEHSDWFKPYVAGYYASVYLGEELERREVEARLDELLGLERAA